MGVIWRVPVAGGQEAPVDESVLSHRGPANFAVRPEGIYPFASENPLRGPSLQLYRFASRKIEILGHIGLPLGRGGMTISPGPAQGAPGVPRWRLLTDSARQHGDLMLVENFR
jgi:hypothetical protein